MAEKIVKLNLEQGMPSVADALRVMENALSTHKKQGGKAVILIHGYGSSGSGGKIKTAVRARLGERSLSPIVKTYVGGEAFFSRKRELYALCGSLSRYESEVKNNEGITVVILN